MIKKIFLGIFALTTLFLICQSSQVEARRHCRNSSSVQLNVGAGYRNDAFVTRRYARPVIVSPPVPVYAPPAYYSPYYAPVYAYPAPAYVEEVYVAPAPRPFFGLGGLSFSWTSFFK